MTAVAAEGLFHLLYTDIDYTVLRLVVCSVSFSYIMRSKAGCCVQLQLTNLPRIKQPRTD